MRAGDEPCKACDGGARPCKGGGNLGCWRRHPGKQYIAAIIDTYGGFRTIVGTRRSIRANTRHDDLCHVVPRLVVHEPIAWNDIPIVVERSRLELLKWLGTRPNLTATQHEAATMYRLRCMEHLSAQGSRDTSKLCET